MLDIEEKMSAIAATMTRCSHRLPLQRAFDQAFTDVAALREIGVPWAQLAATLMAAGVRTTSGGLISDRRLADLFSRAQSKRRSAPRPPRRRSNSRRWGRGYAPPPDPLPYIRRG